MKYFVRIITLIAFAAVVWLTPSIVHNSLEVQQHKSDLGELNHIYYGLFSVNAWKGQLAEIIYAEINRMDMKTTVKQLRSTVEGQLTVIIDKLNERIREANKNSLGGKIKQLLINIVVDIEEIKKGVPGYADALINEMTKPETEKQVKGLATKQLRTYFAKTFEKQDTTARDAIVKRAGASDVESAKDNLTEAISHKLDLIRIELTSLIGIAVFLFVIVATMDKKSGFGMLILSMTLLILMCIGVTTPMIDLEAKISEMSFFLLGHKIVFENQVLYFQSKSVIDVFLIMITHNDILMKLVGLLMVGFSVVFPLLKISSSLAYFFVKKARKSKLINFFAFKSGKWSMADVMVVAIFMAYIGFNGIITNQFKKLAALVPSEIVFITTNGTSLQPGFFAFLAYVLLALAFSSILKHQFSVEKS